MAVSDPVLSNGVYKVTVTYSGSDQSWTVPAGVSSIDVKMWGAGAGAGYRQYHGESTSGGAGAYVGGTISVTPGQGLALMVGQRGTAGSPVGTYGGGGAPDHEAPGYVSSGGGRTELRDTLFTETPTWRLIAGGGGGGGTSWDHSTAWGGGGGAVGGNGQDGNCSRGASYAGKGGTQSTGGAKGISNDSAYNGYDGSANTGGNSPSGSYYDYGGAGGGGYFGGGGGATYFTNGGMYRYGSGGGGGSSFYTANGPFTNITSFAGDGLTPGNSSDSDRAGAGSGGVGGVYQELASNYPGSHGLVVISYVIVLGMKSAYTTIKSSPGQYRVIRPTKDASTAALLTDPAVLNTSPGLNLTTLASTPATLADFVGSEHTFIFGGPWDETSDAKIFHDTVIPDNIDSLTGITEVKFCGPGGKDTLVSSATSGHIPGRAPQIFVNNANLAGSGGKLYSQIYDSQTDTTTNYGILLLFDSGDYKCIYGAGINEQMTEACEFVFENSDTMGGGGLSERAYLVTSTYSGHYAEGWSPTTQNTTVTAIKDIVP